jgi:hypothetical protein
MEMSPFKVRRPGRKTEADVPAEGELRRPGLAEGVQSGTAYNESAFHYFLVLERKRAELSRRPFLLLLVDLPDATHRGLGAPALASRVLSALSETVRETDFVGWYVENQVIGAVLTQRLDTPLVTIRSEVTHRIRERLSVHLPQHLIKAMRMGVEEVPSNATETERGDHVVSNREAAVGLTAPYGHV